MFRFVLASNKVLDIRRQSVYGSYERIHDSQRAKSGDIRVVNIAGPDGLSDVGVAADRRPRLPRIAFLARHVSSHQHRP